MYIDNIREGGTQCSIIINIIHILLDGLCFYVTDHVLGIMNKKTSLTLIMHIRVFIPSIWNFLQLHKGN